MRTISILGFGATYIRDFTVPQLRFLLLLNIEMAQDMCHLNVK